jgi:hypothetical protein
MRRIEREPELGMRQTARVPKKVRRELGETNGGGLKFGSAWEILSPECEAVPGQIAVTFASDPCATARAPRCAIACGRRPTRAAAASGG